MCLAIAAVVNDAAFAQSLVKLIGTQGMFLKQPSLRSRLMAGLMQSKQVQIRDTTQDGIQGIKVVSGYWSSIPQVSERTQESACFTVLYSLCCWN